MDGGKSSWQCILGVCLTFSVAGIKMHQLRKEGVILALSSKVKPILMGNT